MFTQFKLMGSDTFADLSLTKIEYGGDYVWAFDLPDGRHGYTVDKNVFHVYNDATNAYTDFYSSDNITSTVSNFSSNIENDVPDISLDNSTNYPVTSPAASSNWGLIALMGGIAFVTYMILK